MPYQKPIKLLTLRDQEGAVVEVADNLEDALEMLKQYYNKNAKDPVRSHESYPPSSRFSKNRRTKNKPQLPEFQTSEFANILLRQHRRLENETYLNGIADLPEHEHATGAVAIIQVVRSVAGDRNLSGQETGFVVVADRNRQKWQDRRRRILDGALQWGFPGGRTDVTRDGNLADTLLNETLEETGIRGRRCQWNYVGHIPLAYNPRASRHVFSTRIPAHIRIRRGREQLALKIISRAAINEKIQKNEFTPDSANFWRAYLRAELMANLRQSTGARTRT